MFAAYHDANGYLKILEIDSIMKFRRDFSYTNYGLYKIKGYYEIFYANTLYEAQRNHDYPLIVT